MVATSLQFSADMQSGRSLQSSVEAIRQSAFFVQVMRKGFHVPAHTYGSGSDSVSLDAQCMMERAMQTMAVAASGADILGGFGQLETASTISPVQAVIDNEFIAMVRSLLSDVHLVDEALGWHELKTGKPGREFLTSDHTLSHFRESFVPSLFIRQSRTEYERSGGRDLLQKAASRYFELIEKTSEKDTLMNNDIKNIVEAADKKLNQ
jgi:trimethylamine:corrinoid methyltransferase-like protein